MWVLFIFVPIFLGAAIRINTTHNIERGDDGIIDYQPCLPDCVILHMGGLFIKGRECTVLLYMVFSIFAYLMWWSMITVVAWQMAELVKGPLNYGWGILIYQIFEGGVLAVFMVCSVIRCCRRENREFRMHKEAIENKLESGDVPYGATDLELLEQSIYENETKGPTMFGKKKKNPDDTKQGDEAPSKKTSIPKKPKRDVTPGEVLSVMAHERHMKLQEINKKRKLHEIKLMIDQAAEEEYQRLVQQISPETQEVQDAVIIRDGSMGSRTSAGIKADAAKEEHHNYGTDYTGFLDG